MTYPEPTPARIDELRRLLREGGTAERLHAMDEAAVAEGKAAALVADIAAFLDSSLSVPYARRLTEWTGYGSLAIAALRAIRAIGVAPDLAVYRRLLDDRSVYKVDSPAYDQGQYIGDYGTEEIVPADNAMRLVHLLGTRGFLLLPELVRLAQEEAEHFWRPATDTLGRMMRIIVDADAEERAALAAAADALEQCPKAHLAKGHGQLLLEHARGIRNMMSR